MVSEVQSRRQATFAGSLFETVALPLAVIGLLAFLLHLLNLVPPAFNDNPERAFATVEEASAALGASVSIPAYFPDYLAWPPSKIIVRERPVTSVSLYFSSSGASPNALVIHEIFSTDPLAISRLAPPPRNVIGQAGVPVGRYQGTLTIGEQAKENPQNQVQWRSGDRFLVIVGAEEPQELLRIAASMKP